MADRSRTALVRLLGALWPRSAIGRAAWVALPVLGVVVLVAPVAALATAVVSLVEGVLTPVFSSAGGRLFALNLLVFGLLLVLARGSRNRWTKLRGKLRLRLLLDALEAIAEGRDADADGMLARADRSRAPWPSTLGHADVHLACARARLALRRGEPETATRVLDRVPLEGAPQELRLVVRHLELAAMRALDEVLPAERMRRIDAALGEFPRDVELLRARREEEHEALDAEAAVVTQRRIVELVPPADRGREESLLAADLERCADQALRRGQLEVARACAQECVRLRPGDVEALLLLGDVLAAAGDLPAALGAWADTCDERALPRALAELERCPGELRAEDLLRAFPVDGALLLVAHVEESKGRSARAQRARRIALRLRPDWGNRTDMPALALATPPR